MMTAHSLYLSFRKEENKSKKNFFALPSPLDSVKYGVSIPFLIKAIYGNSFI